MEDYIDNPLYYRNLNVLFENKPRVADTIIKLYDETEDIYDRENGEYELNWSNEEYADVYRALTLFKGKFFSVHSAKDKVEKIFANEDPEKLNKKIEECYEKALAFKEKQQNKIINKNSINEKKKKGKGF